MTQELHARLQPKETKKPKDFLEDPFVYIKNKERATQVIAAAIERVFRQEMPRKHPVCFAIRDHGNHA